MRKWAVAGMACVAAAGVMFSGCGGSDDSGGGGGGGTTPSIVGTWNWAGIDVPFYIPSLQAAEDAINSQNWGVVAAWVMAGGTTRVNAQWLGGNVTASIRFEANNNFVATISGSGVGQNIPSSISGTWQQNGSTLTLNVTSPTAVSISCPIELSANALTIRITSSAATAVAAAMGRDLGAAGAVVAGLTGSQGLPVSFTR